MDYQIFICKSYYNKTLVLSVNNNTSIDELYNMISYKIGIPIKYIYLIYSSKVLNDKTLLLPDYNITKESTIHLHLRSNVNSDIIRSFD